MQQGLGLASPGFCFLFCKWNVLFVEQIDGFLLKEFEASLQKYTHSNATQGTEDWDIIQHKVSEEHCPLAADCNSNRAALWHCPLCLISEGCDCTMHLLFPCEMDQTLLSLAQTASVYKSYLPAHISFIKVLMVAAPSKNNAVLCIFNWAIFSSSLFFI